MIALFIGVFIGFILAGFFMGANKNNHDSEIYSQGYEAGMKETGTID